MALLALLFLGVPFLFVPREELAALVPGAAAVLAIESGTGLRRGRLPRARRLAAIAVAIVALVAAARQPFFIRNSAYGAFSAPLAVAVSLGWLGRRVKARRSFACFLVALTAFHGNERLRERRSYPAEPLEAAGLRVVLPAPEARFLRATVAALERGTPPGSYVACFPEPGSVLFAAGRRSPFVDTSFYPGQQDAAVEEAMIRRLHEAPVAAVVVTNRDLENMALTDTEPASSTASSRWSGAIPVAGVMGEEAPTGAPGRHVSTGTLYLRK